MGRGGLHALSRAPRWRVCLRILGDALWVVAALAAVPAAAAALDGAWVVVAVSAGLVAALIVAGAALRRLPAARDVAHHEALVVVTATVLLAAAVAVPPFMLGEGLSPVDALFEAVSAVTTTGLSTVDSVDGRSASFLFQRAWMQWYGGLGIVVVSLAVLAVPGMAARRLGRSVTEVGPLDSTRLHARVLVRTYAALTLGGIALLVALGVGALDALLYTLAAVSTGGFAPHDASLAALPAWHLRAAVLALSVAGAVSLPLYRSLFAHGGPASLSRDAELRAFAAALLLSVAVVTLSGVGEGLPWRRALADGSLMAVSAQTTTGFASTEVDALGPVARAWMMLSMAVGGSVGSTAGGIKILRVLVLLAVLRFAIDRARLARHAVAAPELAGERLEPEEIQRALLLVALFPAVVVGSWLPFLALGHDPGAALFEVVSALGTVGLSAGVTAPELAPILKLVLCADMLLGRLEIVAWLIVLSPVTWRSRR